MILCLSTLLLIPVVLAILTRNKRRMSIPNSMSYAVNQRFDCAYKTLSGLEIDNKKVKNNRYSILQKNSKD